MNWRNVSGSAALALLAATLGGPQAQAAPAAQARPAVSPVAADRAAIEARQTVTDLIRQANAREKSARLRAQWTGRASRPTASAVAVAPTLSDIGFLSPTVTVGDPASAPAVQFSFATGSAGLAEVDLTLVSPSGMQTQFVNYYHGDYATSGTIKFMSETAASLFAQPGAWTVGGATVLDREGNVTVYDASTVPLGTRAPTFTMLNTGVYDAVQPVVTSAALVSKVVRLSDAQPQLITNFQASDDRSGLLRAIVVARPQKLPFFSISNIVGMPLPLKAGTVTSYLDLGGIPIKGVWDIVGYQVCDVASNCLAESDPEAIKALLGTNTFTVTN